MIDEEPDPDFPSLADQFGGTCVHYNGLIRGTCRAGVVYRDLAPHGARVMDVLPCIAREARFGRSWREAASDVVPCERLVRPTPEEVAAHVARVEAEHERADALRALGLSHCCEAPEDRQAVRGQVRCSKCGERLYCLLDGDEDPEVSDWTPGDIEGDDLPW